MHMEKSFLERKREKRRKERKEGILLILLILWFLYPIVLGVSGSCSLWMEREKDGWYIYTELGDYDYAGAHTWVEMVEGPLNKSEAQAILKDCEQQSEWFLNKFGTIYKYIWKFDNNLFSQVISGLITLIIWLGPWWVFLKKYSNLF